MILHKTRTIYIRLISLAFLFSLTDVLVAVIVPSEYSRISINEEFQKVFSERNDLYDGNTCFAIKFPNETRILAVGVGFLNPKTTNKVLAKLQAKKAATIDAKSQITSFIYGQTITSEDFISESEIVENDVVSFNSYFSSKTKSEVVGWSKGAQECGAWQLDDGDDSAFFKAVFITIKDNDLIESASNSSIGTAEPGDIDSGDVNTDKDISKQMDNPEVTIEVTGVAVFSGSVVFSKREAIEDAQRQAVQIVLGEIIQSETLVNNGSVQLDKIYSAIPSGTVTHIILDEGPSGADLYFVKIKATVLKNEVEKTAEDIGLLASQVGDPKIAIVPYETCNGQRLKYDSSPITTAIMDVFAAPPYFIRPIDMQQSMMTKRRQNPKLYEKYQKFASSGSLDVIEFGSLGISADILIKGEVFLIHKGKGSDGVLDRYTGTATLKCLYVGTGEVMFTVEEAVSTSAASPEEALIRATKKLKQRLGDPDESIVDKMLVQWRDIVRNGQRIALTIDGVPSGRKGRNLIRKLHDGLKAVPKVKQIEKTFSDDGVTIFDVIFVGTTSTFEELFVDWLDLELGDWLDDNGYDFEIKVTGGSIVLEFEED